MNRFDITNIFILDILIRFGIIKMQCSQLNLQAKHFSSLWDYIANKKMKHEIVEINILAIIATVQATRLMR